MKKKFPCGHKGNGQFCHRCAQAVVALDRAKAEKDAGKVTAYKAQAEKLFFVPKRAGAPMQASDPVPV